MGDWLPWSAAMSRALTGPGGFYLGEQVPAANFRTSVTAAPELFASATRCMLEDVSAALGGRVDRPVDVVDLGAGGGELVAALADALPDHIRLYGVDVAPRPPGLAARVSWSAELPETIVGLVIAHEYLDNVPVEVVEVGDDGIPRVVLVAAATGAERLGAEVTGADLSWLRRWWPLAGTPSGTRAEIGRARDMAWAAVISRVHRGVAVAIDYDHELADRPGRGSLTAYRRGRTVAVVPDGSCDVTAHVALDACSAAGVEAGATSSVLLRQADALRALGVRSVRPDVAVARDDPSGYLRALADAGSAAELLDRTGLGGFGWLVQAVGVSLPERLARIG